MNAIHINTSPGPLSRRDLLKGGALVVGFCIAGSPLPAAAARGDAAGPPDPTTIDSWIAVHADNTATVYLGKGEFGQGNTTGLLQIAGEELDLEMSQLKSVLLDTNTVPNQGATTSSSSIHRGGPQIRAAAAEARQALLALASTRLGVQTGSLVVSKGVVSIDGHPSRSVSYGALLGDKPFNVKFTGIAPQKPINRYKLVGTRVPRVDIPDKMTGTYVYMQQVRVPDMLHGRIVRPRGQGAYGDGAKPLSIDESSIAGIPGARIVRKGDFVGVVAEREWDAIKAARELKVSWKESATLPGNADLFERMRAAKTTDTVIADWGDAAKAFAGAAHVASSSYRCPYQSHAPFAANCALADVGPNGALVMSSTQDIYNSRDMLAEVLGLPVAKVRVQYYEGSGTFGRSCYDDAAQAANTLAEQNSFIIADLPAESLLKVADALRDRGTVLFNAGAIDDRLREEDCRPNVIHVAPTRSMLADALAQYLVWKQWKRWILVVGSHETDKLYAAALRRAAARFGAKIVQERIFEDTGGARRTDSGVTLIQRQMPVFTQQAPAYDVLVAADESEVFASYLPYRTWDPRPVAGSAGLVPTSWDAAHDQWGAIQMQNRFIKLNSRRMTALDMQAWTAVRMIGEATSRTNSSQPKPVFDFLKGPDFSIAAFKGQRLTLRDWNLQLRQPILLVDGRMVVSVSPQEGFLHQVSELDTLGADRPETRCKLQ